MLFANKILRSKKNSLRSFTSRHPGELATKVRYFGVKSTKVLLAADGTKPAKVGRLAPGMLKCGAGPPTPHRRAQKGLRSAARAKLIKSTPGEGQIC